MKTIKELKDVTETEGLTTVGEAYLEALEDVLGLIDEIFPSGDNNEWYENWTEYIAQQLKKRIEG